MVVSMHRLLQLEACVQVDGHCHWYDMHSVSRAEELARVVRCNSVVCVCMSVPVSMGVGGLTVTQR
jgi:hypothetical protein